MTEVKLLRMELIFARSTLARLGNASAGDGGTGAAALTAFGAGGVGAVGAGVVTVAEVVPAAAVDGTALGTLSVFAGAEAGAACFSFLSSTASERGRTGPEPSLCPQRGHSVFSRTLIIKHVSSGSHRLRKSLHDAWCGRWEQSQPGQDSPARVRGTGQERGTQQHQPAAQRGPCAAATPPARHERAVCSQCHRYTTITPLLPRNVPIILDVSSSTSESSMSSTSRLSVTGSGVIALRLPTTGDRELSSSPIPWKGDSEPVGDGASMLGEGTGDSSGSGSVAFNWSNFFFRLLTRLANVL